MAFLSRLLSVFLAVGLQFCGEGITAVYDLAKIENKTESKSRLKQACRSEGILCLVLLYEDTIICFFLSYNNGKGINYPYI